MNSASATDPKRMVRVLLASLGIAVVLAWTELMFEFPSSTLPVSPNLTWFVVGGVICALAAMTVARYVWAGVVAIPAIAVFAAWSATFFVAQVKPVNWWLPAPPLGYSGMALIVVAVVLPIAVIMATTGFQFGLPKSVSVAVAIIVFLAPFAGFVGFNVSDYAAFRSAMRRANGLDQRQFTAIATRCATFNEHRRYVRDWPPELAPLSPASVHVSRGLTYIPLYSRGQIYVEFRVETHDSGCRIYYFTNVDGPQKTVPLFSFDKERRTAAAPEPRIVTLSERAMRPALAWIVLRNRMLVVGWSQRDDAYVVLAQAPCRTLIGRKSSTP